MNLQDISKVKGKGKGKKAKNAVKDMHRIVSLDKKKARAGWIFVLPFILGFVLIYIPVIWQSISFSFSEINYIQGGGYITEFVGLDNYNNALFTDPQYVTTLTEGLGQLVLEIPVIIFFSLFVAILLNQKMVGRAAFRAIFFIPVILATGLIGQIDAGKTLEDMSSSTIDTGAGNSGAASIVDSMDVENLFSNMLIGSEITEVVTNFVNNIFDIVNRSGVQMLIFLSGLQGISPAVYESCQMEGATSWETFWKITLPMISPMILVNFVYTIIDSFTASSNKVMQYISNVYSTAGNSGQVISSAMSWMYFLIVIAIVALVGFVFSKLVFYQRRD